MRNHGSSSLIVRYLLKRPIHRRSTPALDSTCIRDHFLRASSIVEEDNPASQLGSIARPFVEREPAKADGRTPKGVLLISGRQSDKTPYIVYKTGSNQRFSEMKIDCRNNLGNGDEEEREFNIDRLVYWPSCALTSSMKTLSALSALAVKSFFEDSFSRPGGRRPNSSSLPIDDSARTVPIRARVDGGPA